MKRLNAFVPDEWVSARRAFSDMYKRSLATPYAKTKIVVGLLFPFSAGMIVYLIVRSQVSVDFVQGFMAVMGVFGGFVVTLMLFTGGIDGTDILAHDQARRYADKIYYLLFSQTVTLACYLISILIASTWLFLAKGSNAGLQNYVSPVLYGSAAVSLTRTILLPAQIYERHQFVIETMVDEKRLREQKAVEKIEMDLREHRSGRT